MSTLEDVRADLGDCARCPLSAGRKTIVFGGGNPKARVMLVGEGPGADEDEVGLPFVGRAGRLLDGVLLEVDLPRASLYISNVVKCRPPDNRDPTPQEVSQCQQFLRAQIAAVDPRVIVTLGKVATRYFLGAAVPIHSVRGRQFERDGRIILPTLHPAYVLRSPAARRDLVEDLILAKSLSETPTRKSQEQHSLFD